MWSDHNKQQGKFKLICGELDLILVSYYDINLSVAHIEEEDNEQNRQSQAFKQTEINQKFFMCLDQGQPE